MGKRILVVGSLNMDVSIAAERIPIKGETVLGKEYVNAPGGKGSNQAFAAGKFNGDVKMLGCVGNDSYGEMILQALSSVNVDTSDIGKSGSSPTGTAFVAVDSNGANSIIVIPGANSDCTTDYLKRHENSFQTADILLVQMEIPIESVVCSIEMANANDVCTILNPAPATEIPASVLGKIDYITPNETELELLTGETITTDESIAHAAHKLIESGVKTVIVTIGERGAMIVSESAYRIIPTDQVKAVDTTAAGDCFNGVLAVLLAEGCAIEESVRLANKAASVSVTRKGATYSMPSKSDVLKV